MAIVKARPNNLDECTNLLFSSVLGKKYYPSLELLKNEVEKGISLGEIYLEEITILGVIWYQREGMFHSFPYLHMIVVRDEFKRQGIGSKLMDFFEQDVLLNGNNHLRTKVFLTVGDFNPTAEQFYLARGYTELCVLKDLFRRGVAEKLMMKKVSASK